MYNTHKQKRRGTITKEQYEKLNKLRFWKYLTKMRKIAIVRKWQANIIAYIMYERSKQKLKEPILFHNINITRWIRTQRMRNKRKVLSEAELKDLNKLKCWKSKSNKCIKKTNNTNETNNTNIINI
jgi:hypothetical protein